jgi:hypothetical protein
MTTYIIQAILIERDNKGVDRETIVNSYRSTDYLAALDHLMKKHKATGSYLYIAMNLETQEIVFKSMTNKYRT